MRDAVSFCSFLIYTGGTSVRACIEFVIMIYYKKKRLYVKATISE